MRSSFCFFSVGFNKWRSQWLVNGNVFRSVLHKSQEDAEQWIADLEAQRVRVRRIARGLKDE